MQMFLVVSYDNPDSKPEIMSMSPVDGLVLSPVEALGTEEPESDMEKAKPLAFIMEGVHLVQLFPKREWAQTLADDVTANGTEATVLEVEVKV